MTILFQFNQSAYFRSNAATFDLLNIHPGMQTNQRRGYSNQTQEAERVFKLFCHCLGPHQELHLPKEYR